MKKKKDLDLEVEVAMKYYLEANLRELNVKQCHFTTYRCGYKYFSDVIVRVSSKEKK